LQQQIIPRTSSGSLAMFTAIRRASSLLSNLAGDSSAEKDKGENTKIPQRWIATGHVCAGKTNPALL
jgi:hypothetical protein